ncbi:hypothetical protein [Psychromonas sp. SR45-3]|uniref:hypothetical protein n=1 Tax=Psychromonas sp. SR45-3 TaxID=2760930 RepID=UPI0015FC6B43|nr:hypothetical protein [Psychromonas sp. SR45-3]MBB1274514.1 hypothetical protein [Psychromonas sp. SR45-3]
MKYQVEILLNSKLLFKVDIDNVNEEKREEALKILLSKFPVNLGYQRHVLHADSEARYLKSTNKGMELLATVPVYESLGLR